MENRMDAAALGDEIAAMLTGNGLETYRDYVAARGAVLALLDNAAACFGDPGLSHVQADEVTLEAVDGATGTLVRRTLPLTLIENDNALRLVGETLDGAATEIVFLSGQALDKVRDLTGGGLDKPRCKETESL